jgi:Xaa-Pro aminopeptidase
VRALTEFVRRELPGSGSGARIGIDEYTSAMFAELKGSLGDVEIVDGGRVFGAARLCKTRDELACMRRAQQINEQAMRNVLPLARPGVRQTELTARFLRRIHELGASANEIDPIWQVIAPSLAANPFSVGGDVPFPSTTTDRFLSEGDVLWVDTGIAVHGYASDFGRTWIVGRDPRPTATQQAQFEHWRDIVARVVEAVRPGVNGLELVRIASAGEPKKPWMNHFYLIHGAGLNSAEMPLIGTDLGEAFDESIVLQPGMVLVLEPTIWEDGRGGYRSEEIVAVTETGCVFLSDFPYTPFIPSTRDEAIG